MDPASGSRSNSHPMSTPTRSALLSRDLKNFLSKPNIFHPEKNFTVQLHNAEVQANMSTNANSGFPKTSDAPGEQFEPRQTATSEDYTPDPSKSLPLNSQRQRLVDDVSSCCLTRSQYSVPVTDCERLCESDTNIDIRLSHSTAVNQQSKE